MSTGGEDAQSYELQWRFQPRLATEHLGSHKYSTTSRAIRELVANALDAGATNIRTAVPAAELKGVILAYNRALTQVFVSLRFHFSLAKPKTNINPVSDDSCILHRIPDELWTGVEKDREGREGRERRER